MKYSYCSRCEHMRPNFDRFAHSSAMQRCPRIACARAVRLKRRPREISVHCGLRVCAHCGLHRNRIISCGGGVCTYYCSVHQACCLQGTLFYECVFVAGLSSLCVNYGAPQACCVVWTAWRAEKKLVFWVRLFEVSCEVPC